MDFDWLVEFSGFIKVMYFWYVEVEKVVEIFSVLIVGKFVIGGSFLFSSLSGSKKMFVFVLFMLIGDGSDVII